MIFIYDLAGTYKPVLHMLFRWRIVIDITHIPGDSCYRSVKIRIFRIIDICLRDLTSSVKEPVMLRSVRRSSQNHAFFFNFCLQLSQDITLRSHLSSIPAAEVTGVHLKSIVVFCNRNYEFRSCLFKKCCPFFWIKFFCLKLRNKIFISEFIQSSIFLYMMQIFFGAFHIHISGIPLVSKCRNTIYTPVNKNSKLISCIPLRSRMLTERIPRIGIWPLCDHFIDQGKIFFFFHFTVLFCVFIHI